MDNLRRGHLNETFSATFGINFLEALFFFSHVDDAERSEQKAEDNGHEAIHRREDIVQSVVSKGGNLAHTEISRIVDVSRVKRVDESRLNRRAEVACIVIDDGVVRTIEISTARELVLDKLDGRIRLLEVDLVEIVTLSESEEPNTGAKSEDNDSINDKSVVENDKTDCDVVTLNNSKDGDCKGGEKDHSKDKTSCQICRSDSHIHQDVWFTPNNGEGDRDSSCCQQTEIHDSPEYHQAFGHHFRYFEGELSLGLRDCNGLRETLPERCAEVERWLEHR